MRPLLGAFFVGLNEMTQLSSYKKQAPRQPLIALGPVKLTDEII